jgi:hypothetical protein
MHDKAASSFAFELDSYQRGESDDIADSMRDLCRRVADAIRQSHKALLLVFDHADFANGGTSSSSSSSSSSSDHLWSAAFAHLLHALLSADPQVHVLVVARAGLAASSSSSSYSASAWDHNATDRAAAPTGQPLFPTVPSTMHIDVLSPTLALRLAQSTMSRSLVAADFFDGADDSGAASGLALTPATAATTAAERRNKLIDMIAFTGGNPRLIVFCTSALDSLPFSALLFLIQSLADDMRHATAGAIGEFDRDPRAFLDVCVASLPSGNGNGTHSHSRHLLASASPASPKSSSAASPKFGAAAAPALVVSDSTRALILRLFQLWRHILPPPLDCSSVRSVQPPVSSMPSTAAVVDGSPVISFPSPSTSSTRPVSCAALGTAPCEVMDQAARNALRSASLLSSFGGRASAHRFGLLVDRDGHIISGRGSDSGGNQGSTGSASINNVASGTVNSVTETAESLLVLARWDLTRGHISAALASTRQAQDTLWSTCGWVGSSDPSDIHFAATATTAADHAQPGGLSAPATEQAPAAACIALSVLRALSPTFVRHHSSTLLPPPPLLPAQLGDALLLEAEILLGAKHELRRAWVCLRAAACMYRSVGDALGVAWTLKSAAEWRVTVLQLRLGNWALFAFACGTAPADAFEATSRGAGKAVDESDDDGDDMLGDRRVFVPQSDGALLWPGDLAIDQVRDVNGSHDESGPALLAPGSGHGHGNGHDIVRLAAQNARDALSIFRHARDSFGACAALRVLGWCALLSGAHTRARGLLRESHRLALALDRPLSAIASIRLLGSLAVAEQDFGGARALLLGGVKCARLLANAMVEACTRRALADALFAQGALEVAAFNVRASLPSLERDAWMKREKALALRTLGQVQLAQSGELVCVC